MYLLGYSLDNLSLMALTISTGFVVDDAIVVTENVSRFVEEGEAAVLGRAEGGQADRLHHRLHHGLAARRLHPHPAHGRHHRPPLPRVRRHAEHRDRRLGGRLADAHADDVRAAPQARARARATGASTSSRSASSRAWSPSTPGGCAGCSAPRPSRSASSSPRSGSRSSSSRSSPRGCSRSRTPGSMMGTTDASQDISFPAMKALQEQVNAVIKADPDVKNMISFISGGNTGTCFIELKSDEKRPIGRPDHRPPAPQAGEDPGDRHLPPVGAGRAHRRAPHADAVPVLARGRGPERARQGLGAQDVRDAEQAAPSSRTSPPTSR